MPRSKASQALAFVRREAKRCETATDLHNKFFGNGGKFGQLFPTRQEREAFLKTPEYEEIAIIRQSLPWYWDEPEQQQPPSRRVKQ